MKTLHMIAAAAAASFLMAPVLCAAQDASAGAPAPAMTDMAATPSPSDSATTTNASVVSADQIPAGQAQALAAGDNKMVTNGPVPDTAANRAKYGRPMSNAGKRTAPAGN